MNSPGLGRGAGIEALGNQQVHQRRTGNRVDFHDILPGEAARPVPNVKIGWQGRRHAGQMHFTAKKAAWTGLQSEGRTKNLVNHLQSAAAAEAHNRAEARSRGGRQGDNGVLRVGEHRLVRLLRGRIMRPKVLGTTSISPSTPRIAR